MKQTLAIALTCVVVLVCMVLFYYYMNWVRDQYISLDKEEIDTVSKYALPVWAKDAWEPTWTTLQRLNAKAGVYF